MSAQPTDERGSSALSMLRVPPHDIAAEQAVLGALMLDPASLLKISDWLTEKDFYRADHRLLWKAISSLIAKGAPVETLTLMDWFEANGLAEMIGGSSYLIELNNATASAANVVAYAEIVSEKSKLRAVIDAGTRLVESAWRRGAESQEILGTASHELAQLQVSKLRGGLEAAKVGMKRMQAELLERYQRGPQLLGAPWPWQGLNSCTKGLRDGVLYVVGARPSMGKSVFGLQTAINTALAGNQTAFFSVEMTAEECMARAVACVGEIPHDWVENPAKNDVDADFWWSRLSDASDRIKDAPLLIDETPAITIDQLMARARRAHMHSPLRLIVVDHMHDMRLDPKAEVRHEYGRITQGCKTLAKELKCPVLLLAQLNRAVATRSDKRPTMTDLRESGEIEQKADVVLFLHREDYYDEHTHLRGIVEVIPAKGRNIRTGHAIDLQNTFSEMRLQDWMGPRPVPAESNFRPTPRRGFKG